MRARVILLAAVLMCGCESAEERAARENAELEQRVRAREQAEEAERAKKRAAAEAEEAARKAEQRVKEAAEKAELEAMLAEYAKYTPAGRADALRAACANGCTNQKAQAILDAAPAAEREKLTAIVKDLDAKAQLKAREVFADRLDDLLLERRMNPQAVAGIGKEKRTLYVNGIFCSRQFMHDFVNGDMGKAALAVGFKDLKCEGQFETHTWEL